MKTITDYDQLFDAKTFTVEIMWKAYRQIVLPVDVSKTQHDETKKAFYAGFLECFKMMTDYATNVPERDACELFDRLGREGIKFYEEMIAAHGKPGWQGLPEPSEISKAAIKRYDVQNPEIKTAMEHLEEGFRRGILPRGRSDDDGEK